MRCGQSTFERSTSNIVTPLSSNLQTRGCRNEIDADFIDSEYDIQLVMERLMLPIILTV